jgi:hypothetical protein
MRPWQISQRRPLLRARHRLERQALSATAGLAASLSARHQRHLSGLPGPIRPELPQRHRRHLSQLPHGPDLPFRHGRRTAELPHHPRRPRADAGLPTWHDWRTAGLPYEASAPMPGGDGRLGRALSEPWLSAASGANPQAGSAHQPSGKSDNRQRREYEAPLAIGRAVGSNAAFNKAPALSY